MPRRDSSKATGDWTTGYTIPPVIQIEDFTSFCFRLPEDKTYQDAFWQHLDKLCFWHGWEHYLKTGAKDYRAKEVALYWNKEVYRHNRDKFEQRTITSGELRNPCLNGDCDDCDCPICVDYFPQEAAYHYEPYDPRTDYNYVPPPYPVPPFLWGTDANVSGSQDTDIYVRIPFPEINNPIDALGVLWDILKSLLEIEDINNFPRIKFTFTGKGRLQLYLVKVLQGGKVLVTVDGDLRSARMFDLQSASLFNPTTADALLASLGISLIAGTLNQQTIEEIEITEEGDHYVDITFLPNLIPPNVGFGGGLRKISLCDMEAKAVPPIRTTPDGQLEEWDGEQWRPVPGSRPLIYINDAGCDTCECEDDEMCNCAYVLKVDPCNGQMFYKDAQGQVHYITPPDTVPPNLPPENPDIPVTQTLACFKANGVWEILKDAMQAVVDTDNPTALRSIYAILQKDAAYVDWDNWKLFQFAGSYSALYDWDTVKADWQTHQAALQADFVCYFQDQFNKTQTLSDDEYEEAMVYDFDSPSANLDDFLTDFITTIEKKAYQESAAYFVQGSLGICDCIGGSSNEANLPPAAGCLKVYPVTVLKAIPALDMQAGVTVLELLSNQFDLNQEPTGVKLTELNWSHGARMHNDGGSDFFGFGMLLQCAPGTLITSLRFEYNGAGEATTDFDFRLWRASADNVNMTQVDFAVNNNTAAVTGVFEPLGMTASPYIYITGRAAVPHDDDPATVFGNLTINIDNPTFTKPRSAAVPGIEYC